MNAEQRREFIVNFVNENKQVHFNTIKEQLSDISEMTLRRDLEYLNKHNKIVRVLGGAKSIKCLINAAEPAYSIRSVENMENKALIAKKALTLIHPNTAIFLGSGTTVSQLAKIIPNGHYFIATTGSNCIADLSAIDGASILMLGGMVNKNSFSVYGSIPVEMLKSMNFSIAFLGVSGYIPGKGFCTSIAEDCIMLKQVISCSEKVAILMDSSKVGHSGFCTFATSSSVDYVVSDGGLDSAVVSELQEGGVSIL